MQIIKSKVILKRIAKLYHIDFDPEYKYCTSDAYRTKNGLALPTYFIDIDSKKQCKGIYILKYLDGCFNPFLVSVDKINFVSKKGENHFYKGLNQILKKFEICKKDYFQVED